jgi:AbrB family looped-hinge helix DNA binding protein
MRRTKGKHAWMVKIGEKGQFVIPKEARELFDLHPGDTLLLLGDETKGMAIPPKSFMDHLAHIVFHATPAEEDENA